jgi:8-oxo-dGTP pyrophosphatase MutT (NUDIX family)
MHNNNAKIERVRAIIITDQKILLINRVKKDDSYWVMPGGKVELGESHVEALNRECLEELGVNVQVNKLLFQNISTKLGMEGQQEFFYSCDIIGGQIGTGQGPEFQLNTQYVGEYKISWVDLKELQGIDLRPKEVKHKIIEELS